MTHNELSTAQRLAIPHLVEKRLDEIFDVSPPTLTRVLSYLFLIGCMLVPLIAASLSTMLASSLLTGICCAIFFQPRYWRQAISPGALMGPLISAATMAYFHFRGNTIFRIEFVIPSLIGLTPSYFFYRFLVKVRVTDEITKQLQEYKPI